MVVTLGLGEVIGRRWLLVNPQGAGPQQLEAPHSLPCAWNVCLLTSPTVRASFKDAATREYCVVATVQNTRLDVVKAST